MNEVRKAVVAGQFYEAKAELLKKQLVSCFLSKLGPKKLPEKASTKQMVAAIVPHAGYMFSGPCAAHAYYELSKYAAKKVIILGPNHTGISSASFSCSLKDFETPFGIVENNRKLTEEIIKETEAQHDESAHLHEHSLEVQLPFLQFIYKNFSITPIVVSESDYDSCKKFALKLSSLIKNNDEILVLASSDFTHYGYSYGFLPFMPDENLSKKLKEFDKKAIDEILKLDSYGFYEKASKTTICGMAPIVVTIEICKLLKKKPKLLCHYTSADIMKSDSAVGYASILFS
ncbi:MAG: AmmeMemoRadiSam system protein B [Candidatus Pacearchaeota archaeon]